MTQTQDSRVRRNLKRCVKLSLFLMLLLGGISLFNNRPVDVSFPPVSVPADNGWDDFRKAGDMVKTINHPGPLQTSDDTEWTLPKYKAFVAANAPALALFDEGLSKECTRAHNYEPATNTAPWLSDYAKLRELSRAVCGLAMYYESIGQPGKAVMRRLDSVHLGAISPRNDCAIGGLVGFAIQRIGMEGIDKPLKALNSAELEQVANKIILIRQKRSSFGHLVMQEAKYDVADLKRTMTTPRRYYAVWYVGLHLANGVKHISAFDKMTGTVSFAFSDKPRIVREYLAYANELAHELNGNYTGKSRIPVPQNIMALNLSQRMVLFQEVFTISLANLAVLETEVALRRYQLDNGKYPTDLTALVPKYLDSMPTDPFGRGKMLNYRLTNNGDSFLLYSIGRDMKDNAGIAPAHPGSATSPGDIVAGKL